MGPISTPYDMDTTARDNISPVIKLLISNLLKKRCLYSLREQALIKNEKHYIPIHPIDALFSASNNLIVANGILVNDKNAPRITI
jgi:hypothetical protein